MKTRVAVLNYGKETYREEWNGQIYEIPPNRAIEMDRRDAVMFLGNMSPPNPLDPRGLPLPKQLKKVSVSEANSFIIKSYPSDVLKRRKKFICDYDKKLFTSQEALDAHIDTLGPFQKLWGSIIEIFKRKWGYMNSVNEA